MNRQTDGQIDMTENITFQQIFNFSFECNVLLQVPMGIQIAASIRVGQYLGAGNPVGAMTTGRLGITLVCEYFTLLLNHRRIRNSLWGVGGWGGWVGVALSAATHMIYEKFPKKVPDIEMKLVPMGRRAPPQIRHCKPV